MARHGNYRRAIVVTILATASLNGHVQTQGESSQSTPPPEQRAQTTGDLATRIDDLLKQCNEQMNLTGQLQRVEELAQQALALSRELGDKRRASTAMVFLSAAYGYQGRLAEALDVSEKNLTLAREIGDTKVLEDALNTVGSVLGESGRYEESLRYLYECLEVARTNGDTVTHYMSLLNIGEAYVRSGDPDKAETPLHESLQIAREIKDDGKGTRNPKKATEMALLQLGAMEFARERYKAALNDYEQVHASRPQSPLWAIAALEGMADVHRVLGEHQQAIDLLSQAMPAAEQAASGLQLARLVSAMGVSQQSLGHFEEALASQQRALARVHKDGGNTDFEWQIESRIGSVQRALGRNEDALDHYRQSMLGIERLRSVALSTEEGRAGVLAKSKNVYTETADLLHELHRPNEALAIAERGRARAFLDTLAESRMDEGLADELTPAQRVREREIVARVSTAQKNLWKDSLSTEEKKTLDANLESAEHALDELHIELRQSHPRYASVQYADPASLSEIRERLLDDQTALVEYLLGDRRSFVWVVTKSGIDTAILGSRREIEEQVLAYRRLLSEPVSTLTAHRSLLEIGRQGAKVYRSIIEPIEGAVRLAHRLIIVPDGALGYLPFEALVTESTRSPSGDAEPTYLAERTAIVYGPSASALVAVEAMNRERRPPTKAFLAFGDPLTIETSTRARDSRTEASRPRPATPAADYAERGFPLARLPYTRDEVLAIARLFPSSQRQTFLGASAREETVKRERLDDYRFIHFATHGFMDEARPGRSGLLLSRADQSPEDGILQLGEIMRLKLSADLVTLSACSTGLGKLVNGEGILGLTRAIFYAGGRNVAVSLWNVNDSATATLMESFYRGLRDGSPQSDALRHAKLAMLRGSHPLWRHPYYWAGFVIQGDGR